MSEVMEKEQLEQPGTAPDVQAGLPEKKSLRETWKGMPRKKRRRIVRWTITVLVLLAAAGALYKFLGGSKEPEAQVVTDIVQYGAITSTVEGSGLTKAKNS